MGGRGYRNEINAAGMKRVAARQPGERQAGTAPDTVIGDRFHGVVGAGGIKAALAADVRTEGKLVQADDRQSEAGRHLIEFHAQFHPQLSGN